LRQRRCGREIPGSAGRTAGVTMAVKQRAQKRVETSNPPGAHGPRLPPVWQPHWHRCVLCSGLGGQRTCRHLGAVAARRPEVAENTAGPRVDQCRRHAMASRRISTSACSGPHAMKCAGPLVGSGDDDAGLGGVGGIRRVRLTGCCDRRALTCGRTDPLRTWLPTDRSSA